MMNSRHVSAVPSFALSLAVVLALTFGISRSVLAEAGGDYYTSEKVYNSRPHVNKARPFGHVGPTGVIVYINEGVKVTVEGVTKGSPAEGKFEIDDVLLGINGAMLKGKNPYVALGDAITRAEATNGKMTFTIQRGAGQMDVALKIPVLGSYSKTWPVNCPKSERIVDEATAYYVKALPQQKGHGMQGALMALFLMSTGDDAHLPVVKAYLAQFLDNPKKVGNHTWNNGYNGIATAEYYLRTGDKDVLPLLQYYCDDAKRRQKFGVGWGHWGENINPRYVAGGLMNPASSQVLTTLLLAKECGVDVDQQTLLGALRFFYRFVGHGTVPYGDHRGEGGLGSNGKDGMVSAAMHIASHAKGDTSIYESARDYLSMSTLKSYPSLATGHADNGRGDGMWRGISSAYLMDKKPKDYRATMDRLTWWYDLSRFHDGALGIATVPGFNKPGSGAGLAMTYTAHRKALRITGAAKSKHAVDFELPSHLWGRKADLAFHSIDHNPQFARYGEEMAPHRITNMLGHAYSNVDIKKSGATAKKVLQNVFHHRYMFRSESAKAMRKMEMFTELEGMLKDPDPRVRRAALDGIIDWRYWFAMGKSPLKAEQYTPGMIDTILKMIRDEDEALYVIEGALFAIHLMPADVIQENIDAIMPWTKHEEWWLRQGAFMALAGLKKDPKGIKQVLPTLTKLVANEYRTQPREGMNWQLRHINNKLRNDEMRKTIVDSYINSVTTSKIIPGPRSREGAHNVLETVKLALNASPESATALAKRLGKRFEVIDTDFLIGIVSAGGDKVGFYPMLSKLEGESKQALTDVLHDVYLPELSKRLKADTGADLSLIDTVLTLKQLKEKVVGWKPIGTPAPGERVWRYISIDPMKESDEMLRRERKRFRQIALPPALDGWFKPAFDASKWESGKAPIGVGEFRKGDKHYPNKSAWGDGEFLLARTTFELDEVDHDIYRLSILNNQGFHIYLNGTRINTYIWWNDTPRYWKRNMSAAQVKLLKKGTNTLAVYANVQYPSAMKKHWKQEVEGQIDVWIEALRKADLE